MSDIAKIIGQRIKNYRTQKRLSQESWPSLPAARPHISSNWNVVRKTSLWKVLRRLHQLWIFPCPSYSISWERAAATTLRPSAMTWLPLRTRQSRSNSIKCFRKWTNTKINKKTRCHPTKGDTVFCLVGDYAVAENFIMTNRVLIDAAAIAGVAFDGVDNAVFDLLDDTDMIGLTVLRAGAALIIPIEEDNYAGQGLHGIIRPHCPPEKTQRQRSGHPLHRFRKAPPPTCRQFFFAQAGFLRFGVLPRLIDFRNQIFQIVKCRLAALGIQILMCKHGAAKDRCRAEYGNDDDSKGFLFHFVFLPKEWRTGLIPSSCKFPLARACGHKLIELGILREPIDEGYQRRAVFNQSATGVGIGDTAHLLIGDVQQLGKLPSVGGSLIQHNYKFRVGKHGAGLNRIQQMLHILRNCRGVC